MYNQHCLVRCYDSNGVCVCVFAERHQHHELPGERNWKASRGNRKMDRLTYLIILLRWIFLTLPFSPAEINWPGTHRTSLKNTLFEQIKLALCPRRELRFISLRDFETVYSFCQILWQTLICTPWIPFTYMFYVFLKCAALIGLKCWCFSLLSLHLQPKQIWGDKWPQVRIPTKKSVVFAERLSLEVIVCVDYWHFRTQVGEETAVGKIRFVAMALPGRSSMIQVRDG